MFQTEFGHAGVNGVAANEVEDEVGGGVVTESDHQHDEIVKGIFAACGKILQNAAAGHFFFVGQFDELSEIEFAFGRFGETFDHDGEFDGAGGADGFIGSERVGGARFQIFCVEADVAVETGDFRFDFGIDGIRGGGFLREKRNAQTYEGERELHEGHSTERG